jgi:hypothetical protein
VITDVELPDGDEDVIPDKGAVKRRDRMTSRELVAFEWTGRDSTRGVAWACWAGQLQSGCSRECHSNPQWSLPCKRSPSSDSAPGWFHNLRNQRQVP